MVAARWSSGGSASASISATGMPFLTKASAITAPTGPAPTTITRSSRCITRSRWWQHTLKACSSALEAGGALGVFPPPLAGEGEGGGMHKDSRGSPPPQPSPASGGGRRPSWLLAISTTARHHHHTLEISNIEG